MKKIVVILVVLILSMSMFSVQSTEARTDIFRSGRGTIVKADTRPVEGEDWQLIIQSFLNMSGWELWFNTKIILGPTQDPHPPGEIFTIIVEGEEMHSGAIKVRLVIHPRNKSLPADTLFFDVLVRHVLSEHEKILSIFVAAGFIATVVLVRRDYSRWRETLWNYESWKKYLLSFARGKKLVLTCTLTIILLLYFVSKTGFLDPIYDFLKSIGLWRW